MAFRHRAFCLFFVSLRGNEMTEESFILESEGIVLRFFVAYAPQNDKRGGMPLKIAK